MTKGNGIFVAWYDADPAYQPGLDQWHSVEHMPERVGLSGFLTGQRYVSVADPAHYCVIYRVDAVETLVSAPYLQVLNNPTALTRRMMPGIRNLNRSLCSVVRDVGDGFGRALLTLQFSPEQEASALESWLINDAFGAMADEPGIVRLTLAVADKAISGVGSGEKMLRAQPDAVSRTGSCWSKGADDTGTIEGFAHGSRCLRHRSRSMAERRAQLRKCWSCRIC